MRRVRHLTIPLVTGAVLALALVVVGPPAAGAAPSPSSIVALAFANLGKHACDRNSLGGRGFGSSCTGNNGLPEYWCADFAKWVWRHSGVADTRELTPAAGSFYTYGLENGTLTGVPAVGDAVVFNYYGGGVAEHVALVVSVNPDGTIETLSGDWGGASGSEATFASTSTVAFNSPAYLAYPGAQPSEMGMTVSAFVAPVGVAVTPVVGGTTIPAGTSMDAGQSVAAPNGLYDLYLAPSGALEEVAGGRVIWSTAPSGSPDDHFTMQQNGKIVLYSAKGRVVWSADARSHPGATLSVDDDGELVESGPTGVVWARSPISDTLWSGQSLLKGQKLISNGGLFLLDMQKDGNLVEYSAGRPLWAAGTAGNPGAVATMQGDGDLEVAAPGGSLLWSTRTSKYAGAMLQLLPEGESVVVAGSETAWTNKA